MPSGEQCGRRKCGAGEKYMFKGRSYWSEGGERRQAHVREHCEAKRSGLPIIRLTSGPL
jgi:hypothetical protein